MSDSLDTIIITAHRFDEGLNLDLLNFYFQIWSQAPVGSRSNPFEAGPYTLNVIDEAMGLASGQNTLKFGAITTYVERYNALRDIIASVPPNTPITLSPFDTITAGELLARFDSLSILRITKDRSYRPGYAGANYGTSWEIDYKVLAGWNSRGVNYTQFLIMHEIAHNTITGVTSKDLLWSTLYAQYPTLSRNELADKFILGNSLFESQEKTANTVAANAMRGIGLIPPPDPTYGYAQL